MMLIQVGTELLKHWHEWRNRVLLISHGLVILSFSIHIQVSRVCEWSISRVNVYLIVAHLLRAEDLKKFPFSLLPRCLVSQRRLKMMCLQMKTMRKQSLSSFLPLNFLNEWSNLLICPTEIVFKGVLSCEHVEILSPRVLLYHQRTPKAHSHKHERNLYDGRVASLPCSLAHSQSYFGQISQLGMKTHSRDGKRRT